MTNTGKEVTVDISCTGAGKDAHCHDIPLHCCRAYSGVNNLTLCFSVLLEKPHESSPKKGFGGPTDQDHKRWALPVDAQTPLMSKR